MTKEIWDPMDVTNRNIKLGQNMLDWVTSWFSNGSGNNANLCHSKLVCITNVLWHVWKMRCAGFFDNYQVQVNATVQQIKKSILDWNEYVAKITANHSQVSSKGPGVSQQ